MAYLKKNDLVIIRNADSTIQARVVDMQFRRFRRSWKDVKTNKTKSRWKSVPYAVCECFLGAPKLLVLRDKYAAEFDGAWVQKILDSSKEKRSSS